MVNGLRCTNFPPGFRRRRGFFPRHGSRTSLGWSRAPTVPEKTAGTTDRNIELASSAAAIADAMRLDHLVIAFIFSDLSRIDPTGFPRKTFR